MEKKTIGKFISALRKANGMTQKDLGEKLFVSDKTISRWERDESTPELSLIPSIAEIFGITTDELLRGEKNNPDKQIMNPEETAYKQKVKSDKQFQLLLNTKKRKYKILTAISFGITILGLIAAMVVNLGFSEGLIAFFIATAFCIASEICQICFVTNARIIIDEEDNTYIEKIQKANTGFVKTVVTFSFFNASVLSFCLPLVTEINGVNFGLVFEYWLKYGFIYSLIVVLALYVVYTLWGRNRLYTSGLIILTQKQKETFAKNNKLLLKTLSISTAIALIIGAGIFTLNVVGRKATSIEHTFNTCEEFKSFMETDYDKWFKEGYSYSNENGEIIYETPIFTENVIITPNHEKTEDNYYPNEADKKLESIISRNKVYEKIYNSKNEVICEYYYNPNLYEVIAFTETSDDKMPVTVITKEDYNNRIYTVQAIESFSYASIVIVYIIAAVVYLIKIKKRA